MKLRFRVQFASGYKIAYLFAFRPAHTQSHVSGSITMTESARGVRVLHAANFHRFCPAVKRLYSVYILLYCAAL